MKKYIVIGLITMLVLALVVTAKPKNDGFSIPSHAVEVAPGVFSLGQALDQ